MVSEEKPKKRTLGYASVILGVISLIIFGIPCGFAAIVCGILANSRYNDRLGIVGIILGFSGAFLAFVLLLIGWSVF